MSTPLVIMVGADKGGVGKTTVSRALCDYLAARGVLADIFDAESPAGDLRRFVPEAQIVDLSKVADQMRVFDAVKSVTVIDFRAGMLSPTLHALNRVRLLDDVRAGTLGLVLLHVLGPTAASIGEVVDAANMIGAGVSHFLVKNHINDTQFFEWDANAPLAAILRQHEGITVKIPKLDARPVEELQQVGGSFADYARTGRSRWLRGEVRGWLDTVWREFDKVGLSALVDAAKPTATA